MSNLVDSMIDELIVDHVGENARWVRTDFTRYPTPMGVAVEEASRELDREVVVYWVDGGLPENFSLPGLDPAPIVFNTRFLELAATLLSITRATRYPTEYFADVAERVSLRVIAELTLKGGDPATACYLFARSQLTKTGVTFWPITIDVLEAEKKNESYMTVWFYALLHEIGHVFVEENGSDGFVTEEGVRQLIEGVFKKISWLPELAGSDDRRQSSGSLRTDQLQSEISADIFALGALLRATHTVMKAESRGAEFNPVQLVVCVLEFFHVFALLNNCALAASVATDLTAIAHADPWINAAYSARLSCLLEYTAMVFAGGDGDSEAASQLRNHFVQTASGVKERMDQLEAGQARAMNQAFWPGARHPGVCSVLSAELVDSRGPDGRVNPRHAVNLIELREFIDLAEALNVRHPDVDFFRWILRRRPAEIKCPPAPQAFRTIWASYSFGLRFPLGVHTKYGYVVFIFREAGEFYDNFCDDAEGNLSTDISLNRLTVYSYLESDAVIMLTKAIPRVWQNKCRVVVEGTGLFDRLRDELAKGSLWADVPWQWPVAFQDRPACYTGNL